MHSPLPEIAIQRLVERFQVAQSRSRGREFRLPSVQSVQIIDELLAALSSVNR